MGHNINFIRLCNAPEKVECPRCRRQMTTQLEDYDIDCGSNADMEGDNGNTFWFNMICEHCDYEFDLTLELNSKYTLPKYREN